MDVCRGDVKARSRRGGIHGTRGGEVSMGRAAGRVTPGEGLLVVGDYVNEGVDGWIAEFNGAHFLVGVYHD